MSDLPDTTPGIRHLTAPEIERFLGKVADKYRCPVCGGNEFTLAYVADTEGGPVAPYQLVARLAPKTQTFAVAPLVCVTCGHTTLFSHKVIGDKLHGHSL